MIVTGSVTDISMTSAGQILFQAVNANGAIFSPCIIASPLGGSDGTFANCPVRIGDRVILAAVGSSSLFILLGFMKHSNDDLAINADGVQSVIENEIDQGFSRSVNPHVKDDREPLNNSADYRGVHMTDLHIENIDSFLNLSTLHGATIEGDPRISLQIPELYGELRISAGGTANNRVLNAVPFMDRLFAYIKTLQDKIDALEQAVNAMSPGMVATLEAAAAAADAAAPGTGQPFRDLSQDIQESVADAAALGPLTSADDIRSEADADVNSYIKTP